MTNEDDPTTPPEGSPTWIAELRRRCPTPEETDVLCDGAERIAAIDRQVLWRTGDMPEDAVGWYKNAEQKTRWCLDSNGIVCSTMMNSAPDYRPDEPGPLFLPILDPTEGS